MRTRRLLPSSCHFSNINLAITRETKAKDECHKSVWGCQRTTQQHNHKLSINWKWPKCTLALNHLSQEMRVHIRKRMLKHSQNKWLGDSLVSWHAKEENYLFVNSAEMASICVCLYCVARSIGNPLGLQIKSTHANANTGSVIHKPESKSKCFYFSCYITIYITKFWNMSYMFTKKVVNTSVCLFFGHLLFHTQ